MNKALIAVAAAGTACALAGCSGYEFTNDKRLAFTGPKEHASVAAPVAVTWTFASAPADGKYAVYVDRTPVRPGQLVDTSKYPTQILLTASPSVQIANFPALLNDTTNGEHTVTVVLVDATGHRTTESAWTRSFKVKGSGVQKQ